MAEEGMIFLVDQIEPLILEIRGQKVMLDSDLTRFVRRADRRTEPGREAQP
jgi:hypothetical protein